MKNNCKILLPINFVKGHSKNVGTLSKSHALASWILDQDF
jgi:hypothetical protein